jgi:hypothetical protein
VARRVAETRVFNDQVLLLVRVLLVFGDRVPVGGNDVHIVVVVVVAAADAAAAADADAVLFVLRGLVVSGV